MPKIFSENRIESVEQKMEKKAEKKKQLVQLLENDTAILEKIELLYDKVDNMDKTNKKFLMAATINDGRSEQLEKDIVKMKMGIIELLDQIDMLLSVAFLNESEDLKKGLDLYYRKVADIASGLGIEEIPVATNMKFNPKEQECVEEVHLEEYEDDRVTTLRERGYRDKSNGKILRCAKVSVNRQ